MNRIGDECYLSFLRVKKVAAGCGKETKKKAKINVKIENDISESLEGKITKIVDIALFFIPTLNIQPSLQSSKPSQPLPTKSDPLHNIYRT
jgi:hypothetical protein